MRTTIHIPIFESDLHVFTTHEEIPEEWRVSEIDELTGALTFVRPEMHGAYGMYFNPLHELSINTVAHECLHVTLRLLDACNVKITADNDEVAAYLLGWLTEQVYDVLKESGL